MSDDWNQFFEEARTVSLPLPQEIAANLYGIYAYYNEQRCIRMRSAGDEGQGTEWDRVSKALRTLEAQARASRTEVNVPLLLLNPRYDKVLLDFFDPHDAS